ncbi:hypothetical protein BSIN_3540 [Burkholderia singularis]|uniref:Uncharacterized protein n=1 Tax=Burkholderia singularis TaxID=1503053 RepID=A0A238H5X2_9BURK|nr:hypothetical protein BSIN_3540 [Burkholderia singularis]
MRVNAPAPRTGWKVRLRADRAPDEMCRRARAMRLSTRAAVDIAIV